MKIMILDDDPQRHVVIRKMLERKGHQVVSVDTYVAALRAMDTHVFGGMFLDHDLDKTCDQTGMHVVSYIVNSLNPLRYPKKIVVHSWNEVGAKLMKDLLDTVKIPTELRPYKPFW